jgi:glycosyltransferase involved in cell wall biosynthesis
VPNKLDLQPVVTLVVAMRNEEAHIERCLQSLVDQDYPASRLEVIVADGLSTDGSAGIVGHFMREHPWIGLFSNPRVAQAAGWNEGIRRAKGEIVGIVSGHSELAPTYVSAAVETLLRTNAAMVGGPAHATSPTLLGSVIALAMSTPFGVGNARFRYLVTEAEVDTVYMGVCRRETYLRFPFDEEMIRDQDDELSYRLLDAGLRIVCNPAIQSTLVSRSDLVALARQYADYGYWKVLVITKHPRQTRVRHLVPAAFVAALVASASGAVTTPLARVVLGLIAGSYAAVNVAASIFFGRELGWRGVLIMPAAFATLHLSYGIGFIVGLGRLGRSRLPRAHINSALTGKSPRDDK